MISAYSFASSVVLFNIVLVFVYLLRRKQDFIARYGIQTLIVLVALGLLRLLSPLDGQFVYVIRSYKVIPAIQSALNYGMFGSQITVGKILLAIWITGIAAFIIRDLLVIIRAKEKRAQYTECDNEQITAVAKELGITSPLVITSCVETPHVAGHFRQVVYVPPLDLSDEDWKYVLKHEMQHIAAHDQQIKLFFLLLRALFWWNPVSQLFIKELDAILELRCDNKVTSRLNEEECISYYDAMLNVLRQIMPVDKVADTATSGLIGDKSSNRYNTRQRYEVYANSNKRRSKAVRSLLWIFICLIFLASYFVIVQPAYEPSSEDLFGSEVITENDSSFILWDGQKYVLVVGTEQIMEISADDLDDQPYCNFEIFDIGD